MRPQVKLGYAVLRVSTKEQAAVQHGSLEQQRHMVDRWITNQTEKTGIEHKIVRYIEEDISGRASSMHKRKGMRDLERAIENKKIDFFVTEKLDRIARDMIFNLSLVKKSHRYGVEVYEIESGLIDFNDRGSRLGFNVKNMMAEEYSLDLEEKITKKCREAMVNNGKDPSPKPTLGFDRHPTRVGMYVPNLRELEIVKDIMLTFVKLKSFKGTLEEIKKRGYVTKKSITKEKIDKHGNITPPREVGGENFTFEQLRNLLLCPKYRGYNYFKDTRNQFPKLQNGNQRVRWEYNHFRENGHVIDPELLDQVKEIVLGFEHKKPHVTKQLPFILSGILVAPDDTPYHGASAKTGSNFYYQNKENNLRLRHDEVEKKIISRVKEYTKNSSLLQNIIDQAFKEESIGLAELEKEREQIRNQVYRLENTLTGFSESIRKLAIESRPNLADVLEVILSEKNKTESELKHKSEKLKEVETQIRKFKDNLDGSNIKKFKNAVTDNFETLEPLEQRRVIQAYIPKIVHRCNGDENTLELCINPLAFGASLGSQINLSEDLTLENCGGTAEVIFSGNTRDGGR